MEPKSLIQLENTGSVPKLLTATIFLLSTACASLSHAGKFEIPDSAKSLIEISNQAKESSLPRQFDVFVWNVLKGRSGDAWANDLGQLSKNAEVILLQEGMTDPYMTDVLKNRMTDRTWSFGVSWNYTETGYGSGVANGSTVAPTEVKFLRSQHLEPFVKTPKAIVISKYKLYNGNTVAIINIHGLNRASHKKFLAQIDDALLAVQDHQGAIIFAGDFNTYSGKKLRLLNERLNPVGLNQVAMLSPSGRSGDNLDWYYARGCVSNNADFIHGITTSDHEPMRATFECQ